MTGSIEAQLVPVRVRGVDEVHTGVQSATDDGIDGATGGPNAKEGGAEAQRRNSDARRAEDAVLHAGLTLLNAPGLSPGDRGDEMHLRVGAHVLIHRHTCREDHVVHGHGQAGAELITVANVGEQLWVTTAEIRDEFADG